MSTDRRTFLRSASTLGAVALANTVAGNVSALAAPPDGTMGELTKHELPKLPYAYEALEPHIDARTMEIHHTKHHQAYVTNLNKAEEELAKARAAGDFAMIQHWSKQAAFNGGGHFLHSMFWQIMAPAGSGGGGEATGKLADMIRRDFGSFDLFKKQFASAAAAVEGSGWALLHYRKADGRLLVLQAENQHKLSAWGVTPILGLDVWEHAYYLKYQNRRADYVAAWWNIVNWSQVAKNLDAAS